MTIMVIYNIAKRTKGCLDSTSKLESNVTFTFVSAVETKLNNEMVKEKNSSVTSLPSCCARKKKQETNRYLQATLKN